MLISSYKTFFTTTVNKLNKSKDIMIQIDFCWVFLRMSEECQLSLFLFDMYLYNYSNILGLVLD